MGFAGQGTPTANQTLPVFDIGGSFSYNIVIGGAGSQYPGTNYFPADLSAVGFVDPNNGNYQLQPTSPYTNVASDGSAIGVNVQKLPALPGAQAAVQFPNPNAWYTLVSRNSGQCLDVPTWDGSNWGLNPGTQVQQWTCWGGPMQRWQFTPVSGGYEITNQNSGMQLDVAGGPAATAYVNNAAVVQWPYWGGTNEIWQVVQTPDGYYEIKPINSGGFECLDVPTWSGTNWGMNVGTPVQQWACWDGPMQEWSLVPAQ
jgi:hypothetical protein